MKALLICLFLSGIAIPSTWAVDDHDIHISMCELRFNEQTSSFEVAVKIFIDDLELALKKDGASDLYIGTSKESDEADEHITSYLRQHFSIEIDGFKLLPQYLGKEITEDMLAVWCYVEFKKESRQSSQCILSNSILTEVYADQKNIMDIRMGKTHKDYTILEAGRTTWTYTY